MILAPLAPLQAASVVQFAGCAVQPAMLNSVHDVHRWLSSEVTSSCAFVCSSLVMCLWWCGIVDVCVCTCVRVHLCARVCLCVRVCARRCARAYARLCLLVVLCARLSQIDHLVELLRYPHSYLRSGYDNLAECVT